MKISIDKIIESFPYAKIIQISILTTYDFISFAHLQLNTNAESIHSHRGNSKPRLLFLVLQPEVHNTLSTVRFISPSHPVPEPTIPENSTSLVIF